MAGEKTPEEKRAGWKKEIWASKTAKKVERMDPAEIEKTDSETNPMHWSHHSAAYRGDRQTKGRYIAAAGGALDEAHATLRSAIDKGTMIEARDSGNPILENMQGVIDQMAAGIGMTENVPKLLIHTQDSPFVREETPVSVMLRDYIDINETSKEYFVEHPEQFKAAMAVAMGEFVNGGTTMSEKIEAAVNPANQKNQALALRLGAVIHGNPRQFAEEMHKLNMNHVSHEDKLTRHTMTHHSVNGTARMLNKWADILEDQGAVDKQGNVILERAGEIMQRSEEFTKGYLNALLQFDMVEPKPGRGH